MKKPVAMITCLLMVGSIAYTQTKEPKPPPPPPPKVETIKYKPVVVKSGTLQDFYDRNRSVAELSWETKQKLIVTKKDSEIIERYDIANESEKKAFIEKYGIIPSPPPPPPPPAKAKTKE